MPIGTSDGEQFPDALHHLVGETGEENSASYQQAAINPREKENNPKDPTKDSGAKMRTFDDPYNPREYAPFQPPHWPGSDIHYDSHVPLVAAARQDKDGNMTGLSIDKRLEGKVPEEFLPYLHGHEAIEHSVYDAFPGSDPEKYGPAHALATDVESKRILAKHGPEFLERYKQFFRDVSKLTAEEPEGGHEVHPDDHTTTRGLNQAELKINPKVKEMLDLGSPEEKFKSQNKEALQAQKESLEKYPLLDPNAPTSERIGSAINEGLRLLPYEKIAPAVLGGVMAAARNPATRDLLKLAEHLEGKGADVQQIADFTGFARSPLDNQWRRHIPDFEAKIIGQGGDRPIGLAQRLYYLAKGDTEKAFERSVKLDEVLDHPELYKNYPSARNIRIIHDPNLGMGGGASAWYNHRLNAIAVDFNSPNAMSDLVHELQHHIQEVEKSPGRGSSVEYEMYHGKLKGKDETAYEKYYKDPGEIESRAVSWMLEHEQKTGQPITQEYSIRDILDAHTLEAYDYRQGGPTQEGQRVRKNILDSEQYARERRSASMRANLYQAAGITAATPATMYVGAKGIPRIYDYLFPDDASTTPENLEKRDKAIQKLKDYGKKFSENK